MLRNYSQIVLSWQHKLNYKLPHLVRLQAYTEVTPGQTIVIKLFFLRQKGARFYNSVSLFICSPLLPFILKWNKPILNSLIEAIQLRSESH